MTRHAFAAAMRQGLEDAGVPGARVDIIEHWPGTPESPAHRVLADCPCGHGVLCLCFVDSGQPVEGVYQQTLAWATEHVAIDRKEGRWHGPA